MKRNTHQQNMVLDTILKLKGMHPSADTVYEQVKLSISTISRATVYRILNQLADEGIMQRIHISATADRYDCRLEHHYHMRCNKCGQVVDIDVPVMEDPFDQISQPAGCKITGHEIVFFGFCPDCQAG